MKNEKQTPEGDSRIGLPRAEKLTGWEREPSVMDLKSDLEASRGANTNQVTKINKWNNLRNVTGEVRPKKIKGRSQVQPKLIRRQAEWRYSGLSEPFLSSQKLFNVEPKTFEDEFAAEQNDLVINWQFRTKIDLVRFIDQYVRTCVDEGSVIVRLGWNRITKMVMKEVPVFQYLEIYSEEEAEQLQQAVQMKEANPRGFREEAPEEMKAAVEYFEETGMMVRAEVISYEAVEEEEVVKNEPTLQIVEAQNLFLDPSCDGELEKAKFVIASFETTKAELLKDKRYKNLRAVNWSGNRVLAQPDHQTQTPVDFQLDDDLRSPVVAYEYWGYYDIDGTEELKPIVATWIGDTMIRMEENPFPDELPPFVIVPYLPLKKSVFGEPDAEVLEDNQAILGAVTRGMIDLMGRSANSQQGTAKGFLDATNKRRYEQGQDYEFNPGSGDPRLSIYQHTYPEIPRSAIEMVAMQNQEAEAISGIKAFHAGLSGNSYGDVATGIRGMIDAATERKMNIIRRLANGIINIGNKIIAMNAVFLSDEEVIRVTNRKYVKVLREDLPGNFDLILDINTPEEDEKKAQELGFILQTTAQTMDQSMTNKVLAKIVELRRMPDLAEEIRTWQPPEDPFAEKMKELELAKLEAQIRKLEADTQYVMALAGKSGAEADLKNLDFVERETGTSHARDMQKQQAQALGNQDLEITKALLKSRKPEESRPDVEAAIGYNAITKMIGNS